MSQPKRPGNLVEISALLGAHDFFGGLPAHHIDQLGKFASSRKLKRGAEIFAKGDPGQALFAIRSGVVKISAPTSDGREAMFNLLQGGDIFGEIALLDGQPRTADAVAVTDCELIAIERRDFLRFIQDEPKVALRLIELLCERLRYATEHFEETVFLNFATRLARMLLRLADDKAKEKNSKGLAITQREISQMLGATRESVNKQLRVWAQHGWIRIERGRIILLARPQIEAASRGGSAAD
jgi:CRP/FNR family transcriptional regulator, cyclic AMP receptor protein